MPFWSLLIASDHRLGKAKIKAIVLSAAAKALNSSLSYELERVCLQGFIYRLVESIVNFQVKSFD